MPAILGFGPWSGIQIPAVVAVIYIKGYYDMFQPKGSAYLIPWMIVGIAMLVLVGWISFGHCKGNKKKQEK